jgi:hypothetical protein
MKIGDSNRPTFFLGVAVASAISAAAKLAKCTPEKPTYAYGEVHGISAGSDLNDCFKPRRIPARAPRTKDNEPQAWIFTWPKGTCSRIVGGRRCRAQGVEDLFVRAPP